MNFQIILLGMIQGATEFLPISSSGHLVLFQTIFGFKEMLFYDVILHFATLLAVVILFFSDIISYLKTSKIIFFIFLLSIPTGIIGLFIKKYFYFVYDNVMLSGLFLCITGFWLFLAEKRYNENTSEKITITNIDMFKSIIVGISQGIAVLPGISRSGATLGSMMLLNFKKEQAVNFVFIASIPAILGATLLELKDAVSEKAIDFEISYLIGCIVAFIVGVLSLKFLIKVVKNQKLKYFAYYCFFVGIVSIFVSFIK